MADRMNEHIAGLLSRPIEMTDNAKEVFRRRYLRRGEDGNPIETIPEAFWRVALHVAMGDEIVKNRDDQIVLAEQHFDLLTDFLFLPNSPTFTGAGTELGQLAACFVVPISDDLGKTSDGIFQTLRDAALIQQTGGGNGFSFSRIRPEGDFVSASAGKASGPVSFLKAYDTAFGQIAQGGTRRGANMGVLRVDHSDIRKFIHAKEQEGEIANFNISVALTDAFMEAVHRYDEHFPLVNPRTGETTEIINPVELFADIATMAHRNGEPGVLFIDRANRDNPVPHLYELEATNPCSEQWLGPYENCCLGSINMSKFGGEGDNGNRINWEGLATTVSQSTRFLDNVVSANRYVPAVPQLQEAAHRSRRIGLGIMGLADLLYKMRIRYGSAESLMIAGGIMEFVRFHAMKMSVWLAEKCGPFPAWEGSIYDPDSEHFGWHKRDGQEIVKVTPQQWDDLYSRIEKFGIRNAAQTTIAPTGTLATVSGIEGYGCEPVFALAYRRKLIEGEGDVVLDYVSPLFKQALIEEGMNPDQIAGIMEDVSYSGSCQLVDDVPPHIRDVFVTANDISPMDHVQMQAELQKYVDNSISKTINMPPDTTIDDVANIYFRAWELGCKGITVYRTGSRDRVVLETKQTEEKRTGEEKQIELVEEQEETKENPPIKSRPVNLWGVTVKKRTPQGTMYVTINQNGDGNPFEMFLNVGKAGSDIAGASEAIARLISMILRMQSPVSQWDRLQEIENQLFGIGGRRSEGFGPNRVHSLPDAISQVIGEYLSGSASDTMEEIVQMEQEIRESLPLDQSLDFCPECGNMTLVSEEGCRKCRFCGYSEC